MSREWIIDRAAAEALAATITEVPKKSPPEKSPPVAAQVAPNARPRLLSSPDADFEATRDSDSTTRRALRWSIGIAAVGLVFYLGHEAAFRPETPNSVPRVVPVAAATAANPGPVNPAGANPGSQDSFSLTPGLAFARVAPGKSATQTLTLSNSTPYELTFELSASDVVPQNGGVMLSPAGAIPRSLAATAYFSQRVVNLKPRQVRTVDVTFTVPEGTSAQGLVVGFRGMDRIPLNPSMGMTPSVGSLIVIASEPPSETPAGVEANPAAPVLSISQWSSATHAAGVRPEDALTKTASPSGWPSEGQP